MSALVVDRDQLATFVDVMFRYADEGTFASLRTFLESREGPAVSIHGIQLNGDPTALTKEMAELAQLAADYARPCVFAPPIATFSNAEKAREIDLANGPALSVEIDREPERARKSLEFLIGTATAVVASGGLWTDPQTGELQDKLHLHWRLKEPTRTPEAHAKLKLAREIAARLVGGDATSITIVHPIRWPGSWHRKAEPKLCRIIALNPDAEIDLHDALDILGDIQSEIRQGGYDSVDPGEDRATAELVRRIMTGEEYHSALRDLAFRFLQGGMAAAQVVLTLRGLMDASSGPHDAHRWQQRRDQIPMLVSTAQEKIEPLTQEMLASINNLLRQPRGQPKIDIEHPPGLLGALIDHGAQRCPYLTRLPALVGAIVGLGAASGNLYAVHLGGANVMALNVYMAAVGLTGGGKDTALSFAGLIAVAGAVQANSFASAQGLHQVLASPRPDGGDPRVQLVKLDEWGRALQQIKADNGGHHRVLMTKLMTIRGLAIGGVLPAHRYAQKQADLEEVSNPFVNAIFATTPRTLHDALTSADVVDGSLNRTIAIHLDDDAISRPLDRIVTGPLSQDLQGLIGKVAGIGHGLLPPMRTAPIAGDRRTLGDQELTLIAVEPDALAVLDDFREVANKRKHADADYGPLWSRAFENAVKVAGICALGEAVGIDPAIEPGPLVITRSTAEWAVCLVERAITETIGDLRENLVEHEAERIQKLILRAAAKLRDKAAADLDPIVENTAPLKQQEEIRTMKAAGWFPLRELRRQVSGKGRASREVGQEIQNLIDLGALMQHTVSWPTASGKAESRTFITRIPEA